MSSLNLTWSSIGAANTFANGDASVVSNWNTKLDLPTNGNPFTGVTISGSTVLLYGGSNITLKTQLFQYNTSLTKIEDFGNIVTDAGNSCFNSCNSLTTVNLPSLTTAGDGCFSNSASLTTVDLSSLTTAGYFCFNRCTSLTTVDFPSLTTAGDYCFNECTSLTTVNLPSCTILGGTVGNDGVFNQITINRRTSNIYYFSDKPGNTGYSIGDGGDDMYDTGNFIYADGNGIQYTHTQLQNDPSGGIPISISRISAFTYTSSGTTASDGGYTSLNGTTDGNGVDASFNVEVVSNVVTSVVFSTFSGSYTPKGINYDVGDTITILGSQIGGTDGDDDIIITVTSLTGFFDVNTSVVNLSNDFGPSASYFTNMYPGFFFMGAQNTEIDEFKIDGGLGADGSGFLNYYTFSQGGYQVYVKRVGGTPDPSVNHIIIVNPSDASQITQTVPNDTNDDEHRLTGLSGAGVTEIYHMVFAKRNGFILSTQEINNIVSEFLTILNSSNDINELLSNLNLDYENLTQQVVTVIPSVINLNVPNELLTCNSGSPDGDILYLDFNNIITINGNTFPPSGYTGDLTIEFNDIINANILVGDASNVDDWNTFFNLPYFSTPFTGASISGNSVTLSGGEYIVLGEFYDNGNIITVVDTGCVVTAGDSCFADCTSLTTVDLPSLTTAGDYCFYNCTSLTTVDLPSLTTAGDSCFADCTSLTTVDFSGLTTAGDGCFDSCASLTTVDLPSLTTAGTSCFNSCGSLTTVDLPSLTTAGDGCFYNCTSLTTVDFPSLTTAGNYCFYNCTSLTTVDFPSLTTAGYGCFYECTSLTTVDLPSLISAGTESFYNCTSLTTINIPSCTDLGGTVGDDNVFNGITGNTITLTIPPGLMTCNSGSPDGDIQYLQANNTVTVIEVTPEPTPTPTPTPTSTSVVATSPTPTPSVTNTQTPTTSSIPPTPTPSSTYIPYSGIAVNTYYEYTIGMLGDFSGGTAPSGATVPHPIMIGNDGLPYAQMNAVQIGGFGGLNN